MSFLPSIDSNVATSWYQYLRDNIVWEEGILSRGRYHTRMAKAIDLEDYPEIADLIAQCIANATPKGTMTNFSVYGVYLNYYRDGNDLRQQSWLGEAR